MRVPPVVIALLLGVCVLQTAGFTFPTGRGSVSVRRLCLTAEGGEGQCVSFVSGRCSRFTTVGHLLSRPHSLCALHTHDAIVCCPLWAVREAGGGTTTTAATQRTTTTSRPTRPPTRTTRPTRQPTRATRPPTRPTIPPSPPTRPATRPTRPSGPGSSTPRDLLRPIGLRPRPSLAPVVAPSSPRSPVDHRLPDCGRSQPLPAFRAGTEYFGQKPPFVRSERVLLGTQPWAAMVGEQESARSGRWICAGALVTPRVVLTSAQCAVLGGSPERLLVGLGEHDLASRSDGEAGVHAVLAVERHPAWSQPDRRHALAVLLLARPADPHPLIQPICLPPPDPALLRADEPPLLPTPGSVVLEVAYDLDSTGMHDQSARSRLASTPATVAPLSDCGAALAASPLGVFLFPGGPQLGPDLCVTPGAGCAPDAGSPLVAAAADGTVQLEGLQLMDGCTPGQSQLVLRVRHYVPYIVETISKMMQQSLSTNAV